MVSVTKQVARPKIQKRSALNDVVSRIAPVTLNKELKFLIYGKTDTGKTTIACSFPKKILIIGCDEDGTGSVYNVKGVDYVRIYKSTEFITLMEYATQGGYNTVVCDTVSALEAMILAELLGMEELPAQKSWGMASRDQYGQCGLQVKEFMRRFYRLPCNVVVLGQERRFDEEESNELDLLPNIGVDLSPRTAAWLHPAAHYIVQTFKRRKVIQTKVKVGDKVKFMDKVTKETEFCARTAPHPVYTTKFRVPKGTPLPDSVVDPDYEKFMKLIQGGG